MVKIKINLFNRWLYTFIAVSVIIILGAFVYAVAPDPGHDYSNLDLGPIKISGGNVGIGTTSPNAKLHLSGNSGASVQGIQIQDTSDYTPSNWYIGPNYAAGKLNIRDMTAGAIRMTIDGGGNVGIGTTSPGKTLDVVGGIQASASSLFQSTLMAQTLSTDYAGLTEALSISGKTISASGANSNIDIILTPKGTGNVGIGTASPSYKLDVNGYIRGEQLCIGSNCKSSWSVTSNSNSGCYWKGLPNSAGAYYCDAGYYVNGINQAGVWPWKTDSLYCCKVVSS